MLSCIHCSRPYEQPTWYYGTHHSDNFMCNTCNWRRAESPAIARERQHTYMHTLVRCTAKVEPTSPEVAISTDERIGRLETSVGLLDGRMGRLEEALMRIEQLLLANVAATRNSAHEVRQSTQQLLCEHCRGVAPQIPPLTL